ncbi:MAG: CYTH domain-containing protein [Alphaproteobacteria bacterium]|nr:CYTH domain-containing protein [Alphaproteobacteria bacterium]
MIEVEKKCLVTPGFLDFLKNNAVKLGEYIFEDICLDFEDLRLIKNDIWLRRRNKKYELKLPVADHKKSDIYEEIEDETQILEKLCLENFDDLTKLSVLITHRQKFQIGDFHIDLDAITAPETDFHYNMMEIELMVESSEDYESAQKKILEFMRTHLIKNEIVNGKFVEYVRCYRQDIFEVLKANPHYAHRIIR